VVDIYRAAKPWRAAGRGRVDADEPRDTVKSNQLEIKVPS